MSSHNSGNKCMGGHCWHLFTGVIHMVVPQGMVLAQCCKCQTIKTTHRDHLPSAHA